jgi:hypothetical protein
MTMFLLTECIMFDVYLTLAHIKLLQCAICFLVPANGAKLVAMTCCRFLYL